MWTRRTTRILRRTVLYVCLAGVAVWCLFPLYNIALNSFKDTRQVYQPGLLWVAPKLDNYVTVLVDRGVWRYMLNSAYVALISTAAAVLIGSLVAYGLSRTPRLKGRESVLRGVLTVRQIPRIALVLPFFMLGFFTGLLDTRLLLIVIYLTFNVPLVIWMTKSFFDTIPVSIEEAALLDGCSRIGILFRIVLPLAVPGLIATSVLCFSYSWNEFVYALLLTSVRAKTMPTVIAEFVTQSGVEWGQMSAVGVLTVLPILVLAVVYRRYFVQGFSLGASK
jgi:multiple sugar transport system permease protein